MPARARVPPTMYLRWPPTMVGCCYALAPLAGPAFRPAEHRETRGAGGVGTTWRARAVASAARAHRLGCRPWAGSTWRVTARCVPTSVPIVVFPYSTRSKTPWCEGVPSRGFHVLPAASSRYSAVADRGRRRAGNFRLHSRRRGPGNRTEDRNWRNNHDRIAGDRSGQAGSLRRQRYRRLRSGGQCRAGSDWGQARALPGDGGRRCADLGRAGRAHRHHRALHPRLADQPGCRRLRRV